jgi:hypothetical protein
LFSLLLGLCLLKFSNPPIMEQYSEAPADIWQFILGTGWPASWAYTVLAVVIVIGACCKPFRVGHLPRWSLWAPAAWVLWTCFSALQSSQPLLSQWTVAHFIAIAACFYLGLVFLSSRRLSGWFWLPLLASFGWMLAMGWDQHFGGLEASRTHFLTYVYPANPHVPPELLKKLTSTRVFSTLFYPNALAGALVLLLPALTAYLWQVPWATAAARRFLAALFILGSAGCLYWSGSKAGWLLATAEILLALLIWRESKAGLRERVITFAMVGVIALGAMGAFAWKYSAYFKAGATSVSARFDYWRAAGTTAWEHPLLGTGPGTFAKAYAARKSPEAEMARLTHNDYLQQASDSGFPAAVLFAGWVVASLWVAGRFAIRKGDGVALAVWLGVLAGALQSLVEFGLYLPSMAWPLFTLLGWLVGRAAADRSAVDKTEPAA